MSALVKKLGSLGLEIASGLTRVSADSSQIFIETPLLYPSGTHVIVCIDAGGGAHFVSDNGGGFREADLMGTSRSFSGIANRVAELTHLDFDSNNFYASGVSRENLLTAVIAIANASKLATDQTSFKLATKPYQFDDEQLVERLDSIFGTAHVQRRAEFVGASNKIWTFSAAVETEGRQTVFDLVKPAWQSLYPAVVKFTDLSDLPGAPKRVAVLADRVRTGPIDVNLLSRSAQIIEFGANDETYRRAA